MTSAEFDFSTHKPSSPKVEHPVLQKLVYSASSQTSAASNYNSIRSRTSTLKILSTKSNLTPNLSTIQSTSSPRSPSTLSSPSAPSPSAPSPNLRTATSKPQRASTLNLLSTPSNDLRQNSVTPSRISHFSLKSHSARTSTAYQRRSLHGEIPEPGNASDELFHRITTTAPTLGLTSSFIAKIKADPLTNVGLIAPMRRVFRRFGSGYPYVPRGIPRTIYSGLRFAMNDGPDGVFSIPLFKFRPFMVTGSEKTDLVVFYTNSFRYQTRKLYTMVYCLNEKKHSVESKDLKPFFWWLRAFDKFLSTGMTVINDVLLLRLRRQIPFRVRTPRYFGQDGLKLCDIIKRTLKCEKHYSMQITPRAATRKLCMIFNEFAQSFLNYLMCLEEYTNLIVTSFSNERQVASLSRMCAYRLMRFINSPRHLAMMTRWMDPEKKEKWLRTNLDPLSVFILYRMGQYDESLERAVSQYRDSCKTVLFC